MDKHDLREIIYDFAGSRRLVIDRYGTPGRYRVRLFQRQKWLFFHTWTKVASVVVDAENDGEAVDKAVEWAVKIASG